MLGLKGHPVHPVTIDTALTNLEDARGMVFSVLRALEGAERREGIRKALASGIGPTELAKGLGISRGRLYQLTDKKETR